MKPHQYIAALTAIAMAMCSCVQTDDPKSLPDESDDSRRSSDWPEPEPPAVLTVSPPQIYFDPGGEQGPQVRTVEIHNRDDRSFYVRDLVARGTGDEDWFDPFYGGTRWVRSSHKLEPDDSVTIDVMFDAPQEQSRFGRLSFRPTSVEVGWAEVDVPIVSGDARAAVASAEPTAINFQPAAVEPFQRKTVTIENLGSQPLRFESVEIVAEENVEDHGVTADAFLRGELWQENAVLEPGQSARFGVVFDARDDRDYAGYLEVRSNDPAAPQLRIPLRVEANAPDARFGPTIQFDHNVPHGTRSSQMTWIENVGAVPMRIESIGLLYDDSDFELSFPQGPNAPANQDAARPPATLAPGEKQWVRATFVRTDDHPTSDKITFLTDDPYQPEKRVGVWSVKLSIYTTPWIEDLIQLGPDAEQRPQILGLTRGGATLEIYDVEIVDDGGGAFSIEQVPPMPIYLDIDERMKFYLLYEPTGSGPVTGTLRYETSDATLPGREVTLEGL